MSKILFTYQNCCSYNSSRKKVMEVNIVDTLVESLMEELNCETVFKIPIFGGIPVYESVVVTWIIMLAVLVLCVLLVKNLSIENPSRKQLVLETAVSGLYNFFKGTVCLLYTSPSPRDCS